MPDLLVRFKRDTVYIGKAVVIDADGLLSVPKRGSHP